MSGLACSRDIPLCRGYRLVEFKSISLKVSEDMDGRVIYGVGISADGMPEFLGAWPVTAGRTPWARLLSDLQERGVERIHAVAVEGIESCLAEFRSVYPEATATDPASPALDLRTFRFGERLADQQSGIQRTLRRLGPFACVQEATAAAISAMRRAERRSRGVNVPRKGAHASLQSQSIGRKPRGL